MLLKAEMRISRAAIAAEVERLINVLDLIDGDCDLEPEALEVSEENTGGESEGEDDEESEAREESEPFEVEAAKRFDEIPWHRRPRDVARSEARRLMGHGRR